MAVDPVPVCKPDPSAGLLDSVIIVDGYQYDDVPVSWSQAGGSYGIRSQSYPVLDLSRVVATQVPEDEKGLFGKLFNAEQFETNFRKIHRQAWQVGWDERSYMTKCLRDHLWTLYTTQKNFYLQFDDEQSRDPGGLVCPNQDYQTYFTPTYPIAPLGYNPNNTAVTHSGNIIVYNDDILGTRRSFTVDDDIGRVYFCEPLHQTAQVVMRYTWRTRVRIASFELQPVEIAQTYYTGNIVFEQVKGNADIDPWWGGPSCTIVNPTNAGTEWTYSAPSGSATAPSIPVKSVPSIASDAITYSAPTDSWGCDGWTSPANSQLGVSLCSICATEEGGDAV